MICYLPHVADNLQLEALPITTDISDDEDQPSSSSPLVLSQTTVDVIIREIIVVQSICDYFSCTRETVHTINPIIENVLLLLN